MSISTYFRPNIHQNGPEILGVKAWAKVVGGLSKHEVCLVSFLESQPKGGRTEFHSVYYREGGLPFPLSVVMVVTKGVWQLV
jgi:hypothetical protein